MQRFARRLRQGKNAEGGGMQLRPGEPDIPQQVVVEFHHGPLARLAPDPAHDRIDHPNADGVTEMSCHPGYPDDLVTMYGAEREIELYALCDPGVRRVMDEQGIELIAFSDLRARRHVVLLE